MIRLWPRTLFAQALVLFFLALTPRLFYLFGMDKISDSSHVEVEKAAVTLARDGRLADAFGKDTGATAHVPPLYTAFVASFHAVFGVKSEMAVGIQRILATIICSLGIALLPWLARRAGLGNSSGVFASIFLALYPFHIFIETYGRQETVYAVLLAMLLFATWLKLRENGWRDRRGVILFAILNGVAALTSPQLILVVGLALLGDFLARPEERGRIFRAGVVVGGIGAVMIAPWVYRNFVELGGFVPLRSNLGLELHIGNHPEADGHTYTIPYTKPHDKYAWPHPFNNPRERERLKEIGELAYMKEKGDLAKQWIREHPAQFAKLTLNRLYIYWFPPMSNWNPALKAKWPRSLAAWTLSVGCLIGLVMLFRKRQANRWPLTLMLFAPSVVYLVTHVNVRYRYSTVWTMALLGGYAVSQLIEWWQRRHEKEEAQPSLVVRAKRQQAVSVSEVS